jgi:hypothetical protein
MPSSDNDPYAETFDAGHSGKEHTVHQRIRANSSIMEHKKILGVQPLSPLGLHAVVPLAARCDGQWLISRWYDGQWQIEERSVRPFIPRAASELPFAELCRSSHQSEFLKRSHAARQAP